MKKILVLIIFGIFLSSKTFAGITTEGGGSSTSTASLGSNVGSIVFLFTTPNTANAIFIITISSGANGGTVSSGDPPVRITKMIAGPNANIYVAARNFYGASTVLQITWSYVGIVIT